MFTFCFITVSPFVVTDSVTYLKFCNHAHQVEETRGCSIARAANKLGKGKRMVYRFKSVHRLSVIDHELYDSVRNCFIHYLVA